VTRDRERDDDGRDDAGRDDEGESRVVRVHAHLPAGARLRPGSVMRVTVGDVSVADRASPVMARAEMELSGDEDDLTAEVTVPAGLVEGRSSYSVFVHVDSTGSGDIEVGDFLSPASHPVLTHGAPDEVEVDLIRVGG
jgi:hypothetical protein